MDPFERGMMMRGSHPSQKQNDLAMRQFAEERDDKAKRLAMTSKAAETFIKANPEVLTKLGLTDQEFANFSAEQQIGVVDGYYKSQAAQELMQQIAQRKQQLEQDQTFTDTLKARTRSNFTMPAVGSDPTGMVAFAGMPSRTATTQRVPNRDDLLASMAAAPMSSASKELMSARLLQDGLGVAPQINYSEDPETGTRFATYGNVLQPSGVNPKRAGATVPITGPNGEQLGVGLPNKSGVTPLNTGSVKDKDKYDRLSKQLNGLIEAQGKAAYNATASGAYQKQIDAVVQQIQELENAAPAGGASAPASPTAKRYKLVNGKLVLQ